jgi:hypothetical protein
MFKNRKERGELLDGLVISNKDINIPNFSQVIIIYTTVHCGICFRDGRYLDNDFILYIII